MSGNVSGEGSYQPPNTFDMSNFALLKLPGGATFTPSGASGILSHGDYLDVTASANNKQGPLQLQSTLSVNGTTTLAAAIASSLTATAVKASNFSSNGNGVLRVYSVLDYINANGGQTKGYLTASVVVPAVGSSVTVYVSTPTFQNGQHVSIWDYDYCFSGLITAGGGTTTLTVKNEQLNGPAGGGPYSTTAGVTITATSGSEAWGIQADDYAGINAALTAANADPTGTLYWDPGQYVISATLVAAPNISWRMGGQCSIRPCGTVSDLFHCLTGQGALDFGAGTKHEIPSAFYFPGVSVYLSDNNISYLRIYQNTVFRCGVAYEMYASSNGASGSFGILYEFMTICNCTYAILKVSAAGSQDGVQGLTYFSPSGIIIFCTYAYYFQSLNYATGTGSGSTITLSTYTGNRFHNGDQLYCYNSTGAGVVLITAGGGTSTLTFSVISITGAITGTFNIVPYLQNFGNDLYEIAGVNGNATNTYGMVFDGGCFTQMVFDSKSSWGAFGTGQYFVSRNGGCIQNSCFKLQFYAAAGALAPGYADFAPLQSPTLQWCTSNSFDTRYGGAAQNSGNGLNTYAAMTSANNRASFNGGNPIFSQRFHVSIVTGTSGATVNDFYIYSPYTTGDSSRLKFTPTFDSINPLIFICTLTDNSNNNPNEIRIRLGTPTTFSVAQTVFGILEVGP